MIQIGELAKRVGVKTQTIRYYERIGLLGNTARSPSGYRLYSEETEAFLRFIKKAQRLGFTLQEIKAIWEIRASGSKPCSYVKERAQSKVVELTQKIREMEELRQMLIDVQKDWKARNLPEQIGIFSVCPLIEGINTPERHKNGGIRHGAET